MAITYVGGTTASATGVTSSWVVGLTTLTGGTDSAPAAGDIVVVSYGVAYTADIALGATGYTQLAELYFSDTYDANMYVGYKVMGATPDTSVTLTSSASSSTPSRVIAVHVYRGALEPAAAVTAGNGNGILADPPAVTPTKAGSWIIVSGAGAAASLASAATYSASYATNFISIGQIGGTYDTTVGMGYVPWTSGSYDPAAFTFSGTSSASFSWVAATVVLEPFVPNDVTVGNVNTGIPTVGAPTVRTPRSPFKPIAYGSKGYIGATGTHTISFSTLTSVEGESIQENDIVLFFSGQPGAASQAPTTTGYTLLESLTATDTVSTYGVLYYKVMGATPDTDITFPASGSTAVGKAAAILVIRGASAGSLVRVSSVLTPANTVIPDPASAALGTLSPSLVMVFGAGGVSAGSGLYGASYCNTFTSAFGTDTQSSVVGAGFATIGTGTYNPAAFTYSGSDSANYSNVSIALGVNPVNTASTATISTGSPSVHSPIVNQSNSPFKAVASGAFGFVGSTTANSVIDFSTLTYADADSVQEGDIVFVYQTTTTGVAQEIVTTGYSQIVTQATATSTDLTYSILSYKVMGATPDTEVSVRYNNNTADGQAIGVLIVRGANGSDPYYGFANTQTESTIRPDPPATSVTSPFRALALAFGAGGAAGITGTFTSSDCSHFSTAIGNDTEDAVVGVGFFRIGTGSFNPALFGFTGTDNANFSNTSVTIDLKPVNSATTATIATGSPLVDWPTAAQTGFTSSVVSYGSFGYNGSTTATRTILFSNLSIGGSDSVQEGDLVIALSLEGGTGENQLAPTTAGYTTYSTLYANSTADTSIGVYYKVMGATPDAEVTFPPTGDTAESQAISVWIVRGYQPDSPIFSIDSVQNITGSTASPPDVYSGSSQQLNLIIGAGATDSNTTALYSYSGTGLSPATAATGSDNYSSFLAVRAIAAESYTIGNFSSGVTSIASSAIGITLAVRSINALQVGPIDSGAPDVRYPTANQKNASIVVVGRVSASSATGTSLVVSLTDLTNGLDTVPSVDDTVVVMAACTVASSTGFTIDASGYTQLGFQESITGTTEDMAVALLAKRLTAVDTSVTITTTGAPTEVFASVFVLRGVDPAFSPDTPTYASLPAGGSALNPAAITPLAGGEIILAFGVQDAATALTAVSGSTWFDSNSRGGNLFGAALYNTSTALTSYDPPVWSISPTTGTYLALTGTISPVLAPNVDVDVTGVSATGEVGTATAATPAVVNVTGVEATGSIGQASISGDANALPLGVEAEALPGSVTVRANATVYATGVSGTASVGSVATKLSVAVDVTGVQAAGSVSPVTIDVAGEVNVFGVQAAASVGTVAVALGVSVFPTGVSAIGRVGQVTASTSEVVYLEGVEAVAESGSVYVSIPKSVHVDGVEATGDIGSVEITVSVSVSVLGVSADGEIGDATVSASASVYVDGVYAAGQVGIAVISEPISVDVDGVSATGEVGAAHAVGRGSVQYFDGAGWPSKPVKVWTGSAWVAKPIKSWNGTSWV